MIAKRTEAAARGRGGLLPYALDAVYLAALAFAVPYLILIGKGAKVRDHFRRRCRPIASREGGRPCLWVHGVSAGEIFSAHALIEEFAREYPGWEVVLSTSARAGIEAGRRQFPETFLFSYPFDLSAIVRRAFDRIRPDLIVIVEHELWPNFLGEARRRRVPVAVVNGRLSRRSLRGYRLLSRLVDWPPRSIAKFCVEDELSAERFRRLGVAQERVQVTGNLKFDRSVTHSRDFAERCQMLGEGWTLVAASTHLGEEEAVLRAFAEIHRTDSLSRLVLAPRRIERARDVVRMVQRHGLRCRLWSDVVGVRGLGGENNGNASPGAVEAYEVLVVDSVGDLPELMALGDVVFVGGSLVPFGGHNVIEPAVVGRPVVTGPHHESFRHVVTLFLEREAVLVAHDEGELLAHLQTLKSRPQVGRGMVRRAGETIALHAGASRKTLDALRPLIEGCGVQPGVARTASVMGAPRSTVTESYRLSALSCQPEESRAES